MRTPDATDDVFHHLRQQDRAIAALREEVSLQMQAMRDSVNGQFVELRNDTEYLVVISRNLEGFSNFCARWGGRIARATKWSVPVISGAILLHDRLWKPFSDWVAAYFKSKGGS